MVGEVRRPIPPAARIALWAVLALANTAGTMLLGWPYNVGCYAFAGLIGWQLGVAIARTRLAPPKPRGRALPTQVMLRGLLTTPPPWADAVERQDQPERVEAAVPILARRWLMLATPPGGTWFMGSRAGTEMFRREAVAECLALGTMASHAHGEVPGLDCSCGFYSWKLDQPEGRLSNTEPSHLALALVELSGTVMEHERGFRAQRQRILEIQVPRAHVLARSDRVRRWVGEQLEVPVHGPDEPRWWAK